LAAGESSRFWPLCEGRHKSLFALLGRPIILWTLEALARAGTEDVLIVQAPHRAIERELSGAELPDGLHVHYAVQPEPKGMGDALLGVRSLLDEEFFMLHAHGFTADDWMLALLEKRRRSGCDLVLAGQRTEEPWKYGMIALDGDRATEIVEKPAERAPSDVRVLGVYLLPRGFIEDLERVGEGHYSFENALAQYMRGHDVRVVVGDAPSVSLKYPWDLFEAARLLMDDQLKDHQAGAAEISPYALIEGPVYLGEGVRVYEQAVIKGPCYIGDGCVVGTGAIVREYCDLEPEVTIGAHAEVARCLFQRGASTHSGYFGDSIFDMGARAGAGTVTANVKVHRDEIKPVVTGGRVPTGRLTLGAIVGAETQLGIGVLTMPGALIGARSFVGPGTVVDENVPSDARCYVKQEKIIKHTKKR
jgi:bifunctional UDP-N-acetylglucosamine pyrophosphorylase/glucosamine-1-phosphate N-acetyltransferase